MLIPTLPVFADGQLEAGKVGVGLLVAATTPAAILLQPFLGRYADRRGRRLILVAGPIVFGVCISAFSLAESLGLLIAIRALAGIGEGAMYLAPATVVNDLAPDERRGEAVSLFSLYVWTGMAVGPPLGELILRDTHFDTVFLTAGALSVAGGLLARFVPETRPAAVPAPAGRGLRGRGALAPAVVQVMEIMGWIGLIAFVPLYARELGMEGAGLVFAVNAIVVLSIRGLGRKLPDRLGPRRGGTLGLVGCAAGLVVVALWRDPAGLYAGTALFFAGHSLLYPALMMLVIGRTADEERSSAVGLFTASASFGVAVGAISLGAIAAVVGYQWTFAVGAAIVAAALIPLRRMRTGQGGGVVAAAEVPP